MPITIGWSDIAIRLLCTVVAAALIGFDRGEHGRPAGLRTTMLVALAASISMIQVNLLLPIAGKTSTSFVEMDLMRLPLGILSGMGFIGGGAILRRDNLVVGVTTAATLWFVTVIGLCFGGGQIWLGLAGLALGMIVLSGLKQVEQRMKQDRLSRISMVIEASGPSEDDVRAGLLAEGFQIVSFAVAYHSEPRSRQLDCDVRWRAGSLESPVPEMVRTLAGRPGVISISWRPETQ